MRLRLSTPSTPEGEAELKRKAAARTGKTFPIIVIQEAGLDGFWLHRVLQGEGIESHVVDPASIAAPRRRRRPKTDKIDGEALLRALLAYKRGEPRVCAMVVAPSPEEEDERRLCRERQALIAERVSHVNRIKGLLFAQGIGDYAPLGRNRRKRLEELRTGDGRALPPHLKAQISRELDRLEMVLEQIKAVEKERNRLLFAPAPLDVAKSKVDAWSMPQGTRVVGVSKAGNPRLRTTMVQIAWLWLQHQPQSALARWFFERVKGRPAARKTAIVALARKLLVALWKYVRFGEVIEGAVMKAAA